MAVIGKEHSWTVARNGASCVSLPTRTHRVSRSRACFAGPQAELGQKSGFSCSLTCDRVLIQDQYKDSYHLIGIPLSQPCLLKKSTLPSPTAFINQYKDPHGFIGISYSLFHSSFIKSIYKSSCLYERPWESLMAACVECEGEGSWWNTCQSGSDLVIGSEPRQR